ncbi:MAG: hypothetical protein QOJ19_509 [Acidimicrobiia bacterium]|jgi:PAS domain S-box-containing protein|nr:hypothetical protein [Acidimicrobiia bacterium]
MADFPRDEVLDALTAVVKVLERSSHRVDLVDIRARELREGRLHGASYAELLTGASGPLVIEVISEFLDGLFDAGGRLRRAEARALHAEGLSMEKIGLLLRVSRQRVSALINSPFGEGGSESDQVHSRSMGLSLTDPEFRMIADSLPHLAWLATPDGATEYFNRQGTNYTGMPQETNNAWNWLTLVHPDDQEVARRGWQRAVETETEFDLDYRIRRFDGQFRWHRFRSVPVAGSDGFVIKWIGTATDIDDQKQLEAHLRQAEEQACQTLALLEALYASAPVGFGLVDEEFRVRRMNQHLAAVNGAPLDHQIGRTVADLVPDLWPTLEPALRKVRETGDAVLNVEVSRLLEHEPQRERRWLASYYPLRVETEMVGIGLVVVEVT